MPERQSLLHLHIRSGDIFAATSPNPWYVPPPLSYYKLAIRHFRRLHPNPKIILVIEDRRNPCIDRLCDSLEQARPCSLHLPIRIRIRCRRIACCQKPGHECRVICRNDRIGLGKPEPRLRVPGNLESRRISRQGSRRQFGPRHPWPIYTAQCLAQLGRPTAPDD